MSQPRLLQTSRLLARAARPFTTTATRTAFRPAVCRSKTIADRTPPSHSSFFSTCAVRSKESTASTNQPTTFKQVELTDTTYHELADEWLEKALVKFEDLQDQGDDIDVEFSSGVMTIRAEKGTYVLNKQPPNKQIWLSSPISGPKRYDWYVPSDGQAGSGRWEYARDESTLDGLILEELGVDLHASD